MFRDNMLDAVDRPSNELHMRFLDRDLEPVTIRMWIAVVGLHEIGWSSIDVLGQIWGRRGLIVISLPSFT